MNHGIETSIPGVVPAGIPHRGLSREPPRNTRPQTAKSAQSSSSHRIVHDDVCPRFVGCVGHTLRDYLASWGADGTIGAEPNKEWVMDKDKNLLVSGSGAAEITRFTRRMMVERLLAGAGAGTAWPLVATSHPIYELLRSNAILDKVERL